MRRRTRSPKKARAADHAVCPATCHAAFQATCQAPYHAACQATCHASCYSSSFFWHERASRTFPLSHFRPTNRLLVVKRKTMVAQMPRIISIFMKTTSKPAERNATLCREEWKRNSTICSQSSTPG